MIKYKIKQLVWEQLSETCWTVDTILGNITVSCSDSTWYYHIKGSAGSCVDQTSAFAYATSWYYGKLREALEEV